MKFVYRILGICFASSMLFADVPYLRVTRNPTTETECLEIAVRSFEVQDKVVQLVGVSHIGTKTYYDELQKILNAADVVLFEGIDGHRAEFRQMTAEQPPERSSLQANLARALGLVFQLHHIDYTPEHFINSDVTSEQLLALFQGQELPERPERGEERLDHLMSTMEQTSVSGQIGGSILDFLKTRPGWSRGMRWAMVNTLGAVQGNISSFAGLPEEMRNVMEVLLERRNDVVIRDISQQLESQPKGSTIAVFYGAAHMYDFHVRLIKEFQAVEREVMWRTAFCGNLQASGLNVLQKGMVEWFVLQQVRTMELMSSAAPEQAEP